MVPVRLDFTTIGVAWTRSARPQKKHGRLLLVVATPRASLTSKNLPCLR